MFARLRFRSIQYPIRPINLSKLSSKSFSTHNESYTESQAKKGRPVSPHVTIYKFPVTAISSITNRVTGIALSIGLFLLN